MNSVKALNSIAINQLKGVGPKIAEKLHIAGIFNAVDLLFRLPTGYQNRTCIQPIATLQHDQYAYIEAEIIDVKIVPAKKPILACHIRDISGALTLKFFFFNSQQRGRMQEPEQKIRCYGKLTKTKYGTQMIHPEYELFAIDQPPPLENSLTPIYPNIDGISQK